MKKFLNSLKTNAENSVSLSKKNINSSKKFLQQKRINNLKKNFDLLKKTMNRINEPDTFDASKATKLKEICQFVFFFMEDLEPYYNLSTLNKLSEKHINNIKNDVQSAVEKLTPIMTQYNNRNLNTNSLIANTEKAIFNKYLPKRNTTSFENIKKELDKIGIEISDASVNLDINFDFFFGLAIKRILELVFIYVNEFENNNNNQQILTKDEKFKVYGEMKDSFIKASQSKPSQDPQNTELANNVAKYVVARAHENKLL